MSELIFEKLNQLGDFKMSFGIKTFVSESTKSPSYSVQTVIFEIRSGSMKIEIDRTDKTWDEILLSALLYFTRELGKQSILDKVKAISK